MAVDVTFIVSGNSGSLAMFAAIRRASSRVSRFISPAAAGLVLEIDVVSAWPLASVMTNDSGFSTIDQGGGKRRGGQHPRHQCRGPVLRLIVTDTQSLGVFALFGAGGNSTEA
jgi:hypothetical protein